MAEAKLAGISAIQYAKRHGISVKGLYYWQRKLNTMPAVLSAARPASKFVVLRVAPAVAVVASSNCTLIMAAGFRLEMAMQPTLECCRSRSTLVHPGCQIEQVYLCRDPIDFRKSINGLSVLVEQELELNPFASALYVFANRQRHHLFVATCIK